MNWNAYTKAVRSGNYVGMSRLRFLNPDGTTAFSLDNDPYNRRSGAFIRSGAISVNLQNGTRRTAEITVANADGEYDYKINRVWFGTEIAIDVGISVPGGDEIYFPQGVFRIPKATEAVVHNGNTVHYSLTDKWAGLDGTLNGALETSYAVLAGTNIFSPIAALLQTDRGNGEPLDNVAPVFTEYYNGKTQALPGGGTANLTDTPYDYYADGDSDTAATVILALCGMLSAWVGYDPTGRLRIDPSQDDLLDSDKPVSWRFSVDEAQLLGNLQYESGITDVCNDYIVTGYMTKDYVQPAARAVDLDPTSPVNVNLIGRKTIRDPQPNFATARMCADFAEWKVKRSAALRKTVSISAVRIPHLAENTLVEIVRTDKAGSPLERHLVQGFTLPLSGTEPMTIQAVSVNDFPSITVYTNE